MPAYPGASARLPRLRARARLSHVRAIMRTPDPRRVPTRMRRLSLLLAVPLLLTSSAVVATDESRWPSSPAEIFVGAGDIAYCNWDGDDRTAELLDHIEGTVFTIGDNSQNEGTYEQFRDCFEPSWGRHKWRTKPVIGNHERLSESAAGENAAGYFDYFGEAAGPWGRGYYSYHLGDWFIVVLDSNCEYVACHAGSEQERWLRAELAAYPATCTLALWHHPLFNSGDVGEFPQVRDLWIALEEAGADVVLNGHDHHYERFVRQDVDGTPSQTGMRQFIVGTGGATFHGVGVPSPNSEIFRIGSLGLIRFELRPNSYTWEFISTPGDLFTDRGWDVCY